MSDESGFFVRGFGDVAGANGGIAWSLPGSGGGVILEGGQASATEAAAVSDEPDEGWSFHASLEADALQGAAVFRLVAVETAEGMIRCIAVGAEGISGHGEERTEGVLRAGGEDSPFEEALLSTQYNGDGNPTRIGLELWPEDADQTSRAAATRVAGSALGGGRIGSTWAGLFRCHTDGTEGLGAYLLWRS